MSQLELWTEQEEVQLQYHEQVIEKGFETFYEVGQSLMFIRENRLYRKEFNTFEEYCQEKWGKKRRWADQLIKASDVVGILENESNCAQIPQTESQARPLTKLETPEQQAEAWSNAVANSETGKPTAKEVDAEVKKLQEKLKEKEREIAQKASEVANLKQANQFVTKQLEEQKEMVKTANSMMLSEAEKIAEKKVEAETKLLNQKLSELTEKVNQLETEKAQAEQSNEEAKANYEKALEKFKANPDPETQKAISELKLTYERTKAQVERVTHSLNELKHKEDQAFSASLSLERFNVAFQKLISNHPDAITAMSSRYLTDASLVLVETIADTLDDWAHTIRNSLALAREERAKPIESVEVEVVTETPALKPVGADGYDF